MALKRTEEYVLGLISNGKRLDNRELNEFREIEIKTGVSKKAEGSAEVRIGNTRVIAGVKMDIGEPFADSPDKGILITNAEFLAMAAPEFEPGLPGEDAIELARVVDRGIRESGSIDFEKLCIIEGEKVWMVFVDIFVVNHDGNLIDAANLAAVAALLNTKIPSLSEDKEEIIRDEYLMDLPMKDIPIAVTFRKHGNRILVDTTALEEDVIPGKLTITTKANGNITAIQLSGGVAFKKEEIIKCAKMSQDIGKKIREKYFKEEMKKLNLA